MHRLLTALGMPQHRFASIHVVGTNGKSSVTLMIAGLLDAHGVRSGAYVSPHVGRWSERVMVVGRPIDPAAFDAAVARTAEAAAVVNRSLGGGEEVTQFEVATAAAFVALAKERVGCAVVEAGLGGRLDATNVLPSRVTVLTSVGLEHTEWLGDTEDEIAAEKLAVLRDQSVLALGRVGPKVRRLAERVAAERGARLVVAPAEPEPGVDLLVSGAFQRRNFALAQTAARAFLGELDPAATATVARKLELPGRLERVAEDPLCILDAAHNPAAAAALAEALGEVAGERPVIACLAMLTDKDAGGFLDALAPALAAAVCTELPGAALRSVGRPGAAARPAADLAALATGRGIDARQLDDPGRALAECRGIAARLEGVAVATGSHYLLGAARAAWTRPS
jgi:dihydrofolate synthase / folylpolyglutamate synthase